jgi:hypothetical protein
MDNFSAITNAVSPVVRVKVDPAAYYDLGKMQDIQKAILGRLGCPGCTSGFDIRFEMIREREFIVDKDLNIQAGQIGNVVRFSS